MVLSGFSSLKFRIGGVTCQTLFAWWCINSYFTPSRGVMYCDLCVCLFVCPLVCLKNRPSKFHQIFCTLFWWRGLVLLWWHCNTLCISVLWMMCCFHMLDENGPNQRRHVCFIQFARCWQQLDVRRRCLDEVAWWRHRGRSLPSLTAYCSCELSLVVFNIQLDLVFLIDPLLNG